MSQPNRGLPHYLFICVHNAGRSQMAAAICDRLAGGRARASSAGTQPAPHINPTVVEALAEIGIDISTRQPQLLSDDLAAGAQRVIAMGCSIEEACPSIRTDENWDLLDPAGRSLAEVRAIRDEIYQRVQGLLEQAATPSGKT